MQEREDPSAGNNRHGPGEAPGPHVNTDQEPLAVTTILTASQTLYAGTARAAANQDFNENLLAKHLTISNGDGESDEGLGQDLPGHAKTSDVRHCAGQPRSPGDAPALYADGDGGGGGGSEGDDGPGEGRWNCTACSTISRNPVAPVCALGHTRREDGADDGGAGDGGGDGSVGGDGGRSGGSAGRGGGRGGGGRRGHGRGAGGAVAGGAVRQGRRLLRRRKRGCEEGEGHQEMMPLHRPGRSPMDEPLEWGKAPSGMRGRDGGRKGGGERER